MTAQPAVDPYWGMSDEDRIREASRAFMNTAQRLPTIFDLGDMEMAILALIEDAEARGEEPEDGLDTQLAQVTTALAAKTEGYVSVIRQLQHLRDARKAEADRLRARAATADRAADWLLNRLKVHLQSTGQERIETARFTIALRQNPPKVEVLEDMLVPPEYKRTVVTTTVDKTAIKDHWKKTGEVVPGVEVTRGERVEIR